MSSAPAPDVGLRERARAVAARIRPRVAAWMCGEAVADGRGGGMALFGFRFSASDFLTGDEDALGLSLQRGAMTCVSENGSRICTLH